MITPKGNQVLIRPLPDPEWAGKGILLSKYHTPEQQMFQVLAVGPGRRQFSRKNRSWFNVPIELTIGSRVLIDQYRIKARTEAGHTQEGYPLFLVDAESIALELP